MTNSEQAGIRRCCAWCLTIFIGDDTPPPVACAREECQREVAVMTSLESDGNVVSARTLAEYPTGSAIEHFGLRRAFLTNAGALPTDGCGHPAPCPSCRYRRGRRRP